MNPHDSSFGGVYRDRRVLVTGHTGFKGGWLCEWLYRLGARVTGLSLAPQTQPALFDQLQLAGQLEHRVADIRDAPRVREVVAETQPDFVFHLAAQPLVRWSYEQPIETYAANVMGTVHVLDALRALQKPCAAVFVTTDKCYENREWLHAYREEDPLGGYDPYSSSKAAAEIAITSFRRSFFHPDTDPLVKIASARAGNVIGGGDWALDRLVPDIMRALVRGESVPVRHPAATRPWQHVLEPLSGYLWLGAMLAEPALLGNRHTSADFSSAFNFGPGTTANRSVGALVAEALKHRAGRWEDRSDPAAVHEAGLLNLATDKAFHLLQWQPVWSFEDTVAQTIRWYDAVEKHADPLALTRTQIATYTADATALRLPWALLPPATQANPIAAPPKIV